MDKEILKICSKKDESIREQGDCAHVNPHVTFLHIPVSTKPSFTFTQSLHMLYNYSGHINDAQKSKVQFKFLRMLADALLKYPTVIRETLIMNTDGPTLI